MEGNPRPIESSSDVKVEIGHVLFIDIVGYSKLLINDQSAQLQTLNELEPDPYVDPFPREPRLGAFAQKIVGGKE